PPRGAPSGASRDLADEVLQALDFSLQRLALDLAISDFGVAGERGKQFALGAVQIRSRLVGAVEGDGEASPRVADRHGENRPGEIVGQPGAGLGDRERRGGNRGGEGRVAVAQGLPMLSVPADAFGSTERLLLVAKDRRRSEAKGLQRLLDEPALD